MEANSEFHFLCLGTKQVNPCSLGAFILTLEKFVPEKSAPTELFSGPKQRVLRQLLAWESTLRVSIATWVPAGRPRSSAESCLSGLRGALNSHKQEVSFCAGDFFFFFFVKIDF